jgi:hypothetical protein
MPQQTPTVVDQATFDKLNEALRNAQSTSDPAAVLRGLRAQRDELSEQRSTLMEQRSEIVEQIQETRSNGIPTSGLEGRLAEVEKRISSVDQQIASANALVASASAIPGATVEPAPPMRHGPPQEAYVIGALFIVVVFFPLSIAMARRIWRRSAAAVTAIPGELLERLRAIEQSTEAIAVEVERIGEGQRFMSRLFSERGDARALGEGAAQPIELPARERVPNGSSR